MNRHPLPVYYWTQAASQLEAASQSLKTKARAWPHIVSAKDGLHHPLALSTTSDTYWSRGLSSCTTLRALRMSRRFVCFVNSLTLSLGSCVDSIRFDGGEGTVHARRGMGISDRLSQSWIRY